MEADHFPGLSFSNDRALAGKCVSEIGSMYDTLPTACFALFLCFRHVLASLLSLLCLFPGGCRVRAKDFRRLSSDDHCLKAESQ